ncbi:MAG TPA: STM3941 family protein [Ktedonobacterales bacterium]|nr:STM3941 family protein [Ktedonobacterales bacterium]
MGEGQPLRLYANPLKLLLVLFASVIFVAVGLWILHDPRVSTNPVNVFIAWVTIVFFGLGVVIIPIIIIRDVVLRRAVLEINEQGWSCRSTLFVKKQTASWQDIDHVAIYRQQLSQRQTMYYLVVHGVDPSKVARRSRFSARMYRFYPALRESLMAIPLNNLFVRTTPAKVAQILERIRMRYAYELRLYGVQVDTEIHAL